MTRLTILNDIVHTELDESLRLQQSWGMQIADLRGIYGKQLLDLTDEEAERAARAVEAAGMSTYCLSFGLFYGDVERGEAHFRDNFLARVPRAIELARIFQPRKVRLLSAESSKRAEFRQGIDYVQDRHPWLLPLYREAIDQITAAGFRPTLENEVRGNLLTRPDEIVAFFKALDREGRVSFTYDVQNLWLMGTFPTVDVYRQLAPITDYVHLKGGRVGDDGKALTWQSSLEDASWPVLDIVREVLQDGRCEAICLNPSHGQAPEGYSPGEVNLANVKYLRQHLPQLR